MRTRQNLQDLSFLHVTTEPYTHQNLLDYSVLEQFWGLLDLPHVTTLLTAAGSFKIRELGNSKTKGHAAPNLAYTQQKNLH